MSWGGGGVQTPINKSALATSVSPASTTLTSAYSAGWVTSWVTAAQAQYARLFLILGTGDATTIQLRVEVEDGTDTDGHTAMRVSDGAAEIDEVQITPAAASATERYALQVFVPECRRFRVRAKKTGGAGTVTLALEYLLDTAS